MCVWGGGGGGMVLNFPFLFEYLWARPGASLYVVIIGGYFAVHIEEE